MLETFAFATGTGVALLVLFHVCQRLFSPAHTLAADARGPNVAYLLVQAGHVLAALLLVPGIVRAALAHHESIGTRALWAGAFVLEGVVLIQIVAQLGIRLLLHSRLRAELERGNAAAGVTAAASHVAVGILAAPAIAGADVHDLALSIAFFGLAVIAQAVLVTLYRALTTYDDAEQIQGENLAAAISYAGVSVGVAIVLARALEGGDFEGWVPALTGFGEVAAFGLVLYPVRQIVVQGLILGRRPTLRGGALDEAVAERNAGMAVLEALTYVATAIAITELLP